MRPEYLATFLLEYSFVELYLQVNRGSYNTDSYLEKKYSSRGTKVCFPSRMGCMRMRVPCSDLMMNTSFPSILTIVPMLPFTKPLSLSTLRVRRTRIPTSSTRMPASAVGSPMTPWKLSIFAAASGNSTRRRSRLIALAPLFVTVRKVNVFPVACSKRMACCTADGKSFGRRRPWKKVSRVDLVG